MTSAQASLVLQHLRRLAGPPPDAQPSDAQLLECFTAQRDEAAFAALVRRHGPMVLNVCRSVLHHEQDAEDAFQATFLVLARKAASLRRPGAVAGWLYEVAYRVAIKAQAAAARRRAQERKASPMAAVDPTLDMTLRDLRRVLHEELRRLPDKYRLPLVLCYLEGRSQEEAAGQLGWSKGTLRGRLDRGREQLRRRLAARGVTLSALLCATAVAPKVAAAALVDGVVAGALSARAAALAEGVIRTMFLGKLQVVTTVLLAAGLVAGAGALTRQALAAKEQPAGNPHSEVGRQEAKPVAAKPADGNGSTAYGGRVLGPDGRPVAGARLFLIPSSAYLKRPAPSAVYTTTGSDGRFQFKAPKAVLGSYQTMTLVATARDHGVAWRNLDPRAEKGNVTLHLVKDNVPVAGQVVDLQGRPIRGATVRVLRVKAATGEDLGPWLRAVKSKQGRCLPLEQKYLSRELMSQEVPDLPQQVSTDAEGRFRLTGIGRDRLVHVRISGPALATQDLHILTRPGQPIEVPEATHLDGSPASVRTYYAAGFRYVAGPTKPVVGMVRDKDTKQPLAGVTVQGYKMANNPIHGLDIIQTTTDAQGRYRLAGMPKGEGNKIVIVPGSDQPYLRSVRDVPDSPGLDPVTVDVELKRGVWIEGRITDKATGKLLGAQVQWAQVQYFALRTNPNLSDYAGFDAAFSGRPIWNVKKDGSFRVVGLPGPGVLAMVFSDHYLVAAERDDAEGAKGPFVNTAQSVIVPVSYNALASIDPAKGTESVRRDLTLDPGLTFTGTVLGPDGKPLDGVRAFGLTAWAGWEGPPLKTASFTVRAFNPRRPRPVLFRHVEKGLAGVLEPPKEASQPVTVRVQPGAAVTGRLVDAEGRPRANVELDLSIRARGDVWDAYSLPLKIKTDEDGRFRADTLLPGYQFQLYDPQGSFQFGDGLRAGETKDLGDVQMQRANG